MPKLIKSVNHDFTVIGNSIFRDPKLKGIDRGILGTMLSLADGWNFSIKGLSKILPDGETAIANSLKRIEEAGYLIRRRVYENGKIVDWEYIISDEPMAGERSEPKKTDKGNKSNSCLNAEKQDVEKLDLENQDVVNQHLENPHDNKISNNKISNNKINNNKISIDRSIYLSTYDKKTTDKASANERNDRSDGTDKTDMIDKNEYRCKIGEINERIELEYLLSQKSSSGAPLYQPQELNELVELIAWAELSKRPTMKIGGENVDSELVRSRFAILDESHIEYVCERLHETSSKIKNRQNYLLTCLYNAPSSIDGYISNQINHAMYGGNCSNG